MIFLEIAEFIHKVKFKKKKIITVQCANSFIFV